MELKITPKCVNYVVKGRDTVIEKISLKALILIGFILCHIKNVNLMIKSIFVSVTQKDGQNKAWYSKMYSKNKLPLKIQSAISHTFVLCTRVSKHNKTIIHLKSDAGTLK